MTNAPELSDDSPDVYELMDPRYPDGAVPCTKCGEVVKVAVDGGDAELWCGCSGEW